MYFTFKPYQNKTKPCELATTIIPILQMKKLSQKVVKEFVQAIGNGLLYTELIGRKN